MSWTIIDSPLPSGYEILQFQFGELLFCTGYFLEIVGVLFPIDIIRVFIEAKLCLYWTEDETSQQYMIISSHLLLIIKYKYNKNIFFIIINFL